MKFSDVSEKSMKCLILSFADPRQDCILYFISLHGVSLIYVCFAIGTSHSGGYSQEAVVYALKHCNYRLIDTAKRYGCEEFLQSAIHVSF